jgi:hypothetical protein|tara:strand:- start:3843 stop:4043 length:201 start_codon:yes stop_codon:yes gene_type:complete
MKWILIALLIFVPVVTGLVMTVRELKRLRGSRDEWRNDALKLNKIVRQLEGLKSIVYSERKGKKNE